jgi:lipopolysaccharide transport system permease protein
VLLLGALVIYPDLGFSLRLLTVPLFTLLLLCSALGFGLWLAALSARYRDVRHAVPFLLQAWLFATPVV